MALRLLKNKMLSPVYDFYEQRLFKTVKKGKIPLHVGFILDGNRRYASSLGFNFRRGHVMGADKVEELLEWCFDIGIKIVTLYAFSTENFQRSRDEVNDIMELTGERFNKIARNRKIINNEVRVKAIGNIEILPEDVKAAIRNAEKSTEKFTRHYLNVCIAYGSRDEVVEAVKKIASDVQSGKLLPEQITLDTLRDNMFTKKMPDPDFIIRTGGESRLSNFLLIQAAYSELFFIDIYFPAFRKIDLLRIVREFQKTDRRYGR
ncbi:MAG: polyprenyl diphosphate synthase [Candidatus Methanofastidiosia archaeon]